MDKNQIKQFYAKNKNNIYIFQIGFNKCGTRSLSKFFSKNGIKSVHYDGGKIAKTMYRHHNKNEPLIDIRYRNVVFFSDMENIVGTDKPMYVAQNMYKKLNHQYPNSIFILNTRNKKKWLKSRILHGEGNYLETISNKLGKTEEEVVQMWSLKWDRHHQDVKDFFSDKPGKLLIYNIETDPIHKVVKFFSPIFKLDARYYQHLGKTKI